MGISLSDASARVLTDGCERPTVPWLVVWSSTNPPPWSLVVPLADCIVAHATCARNAISLKYLAEVLGNRLLHGEHVSVSTMVWCVCMCACAHACTCEKLCVRVCLPARSVDCGT